MRKHKRKVYSFGWTYHGPDGQTARIYRGRITWLDRRPGK